MADKGRKKNTGPGKSNQNSENKPKDAKKISPKLRGSPHNTPSSQEPPDDDHISQITAYILRQPAQHPPSVQDTRDSLRSERRSQLSRASRRSGIIFKELARTLSYRPDAYADASLQSDTTLPSFKETEKGEYDPFAERNVSHPNSDVGTLLQLLTSCMSSGVLAMPHAYALGGLTFALVFSICVGMLCVHCAHILVKSSHIVCKRVRRPSLTYAETGQLAFETGPKKFYKLGRYVKIFVRSSLVATYYGALLVYTVLTAESFKKVADFYTAHDNRLQLRIWIAFLFVPFAALCLIRRLKFLIPFSWVATISLTVGVCITVYYIAMNFKDPSGLPNVGELDNIPLFFSTAIFAMQAIGVVMPLENNMKNPSHFLGCPGVLVIAAIINVTIYTVMGFFGYSAFREKTEASITFNLPISEIPAQTVNIAVGVAIACTFPLQFFVGTEIVLDILQYKIPKEKFSMFQNFYRIGVVAVTVGIAIAIPNLGPIISLVGSIFFSILGLVLPAIIETVTCYDGMLGRGNWILLKNIGIAIFALLSLVFGTYESVCGIIKAY